MPTSKSSLRDESIGNRLKLRRLQLGLSQESLGLALGLTFAQVQKYEAGNDRIEAARLQQIAAILQVPILFFFGGTLSGAHDRTGDCNVRDLVQHKEESAMDPPKNASVLQPTPASNRCDTRRVARSIT